MDGLVQALCFFCVVGSPPQPQQARSSWDIWYTHETPAAGVHVLRLSTTDFILDTNGFRVQRLDAFAQRFADASCHGRFQLNPADRPTLPPTRTVYARNYIFRCR